MNNIIYRADIPPQQGIGKRLIQEVQNNTTAECRVVLLAAPKAVDYYPHIGFTAPPFGMDIN